MQVVRTATIQDKYAWLAANIPLMPGSGIVYCTTTRDCDRLVEFLRGCGIEAVPYHAKRDSLERSETLARFDANEVKCVVATSDLGMGYDKDDIAFVVHFQMPSGIVAYYQQIGRAGRKLDHAYAILFAGDETDLAIQRHFIEGAFPTEEETLEVMRIVGSSPAGVRYTDILGQSNISNARMSKALDFLQNDGYVERQGSAYVQTGTPFVYDREHYDAITRRRYRELDEMVALSRSTTCLSQGVVAALGDLTAPPCGRCANCRGEDVFAMARPDADLMRRIDDFVDRDHLRIAPRRRWPSRTLGNLAGDSSTVIKVPNEEGLSLVRLGFGNLGQMAQAYLEGASALADALVDRAVEILAPVVSVRGVEAIVPVPSCTTTRSSEIARALSGRLGLPVVEALEKTPAPSQAELYNRFFKCENALTALHVAPHVTLPARVLVVDDALDSGWTLTAAGARLQQAAPGVRVVPFALVSLGVS
jgi:ATP-dependent DNA helicase RecQ